MSIYCCGLFAFQYNLLAVLFLYLGLLFDFADGVVARCTRTVTKYQAVYLERIATKCDLNCCYILWRDYRRKE